MFILSELFFRSPLWFCKPFCVHRVGFAFPAGKTWLLVGGSVQDINQFEQAVLDHEVGQSQTFL